MNQDHERIKIDGTKALELAGFNFLGLAPEGGRRVRSFLEQAAEALVEGKGSSNQLFLGKTPTFSPPHQELEG
ncbi:hypothetical protein CMV_010500 [Castanea mollissima]|uniref:Sterol methyltransferase C-terminal domain-containing protein n=1 Tax=Castanea mollissima TaxID=60419 RepID=A0A8J4RCK0_9ROSI|nr:hypothetical protein CMV_010500 [Castanea mollissima]